MNVFTAEAGHGLSLTIWGSETDLEAYKFGSFGMCHRNVDRGRELRGPELRILPRGCYEYINFMSCNVSLHHCRTSLMKELCNISRYSNALE